MPGLLAPLGMTDVKIYFSKLSEGAQAPCALISRGTQVAVHHGFPPALGAQNDLDGLADRAQAAGRFCYIMDMPVEERMAVLYAHRKPHTLQDGNVHQVIAHVADFFIVHSGSLQNTLVRRNLLENVFLNKIQLQL